ncbi:hypothetical protein [Oceanivirga miroungae]|uniref:Uncharacterized protein n=1 Tax=Oceanivirga miroungae TaxID=1130046 RepID=A0A6I8M788_9FUSO|nr:hypothetical protein [Oceanivirga miroungae]VWL85734.1 hypothetical protein OMES3154_01022 [Oceanivirga miroungae]
MIKIYIYHNKKDYKYYLMLKIKLSKNYDIVDDIDKADFIIVMFSKNLEIELKDILKPYLVVYANNTDIKLKKLGQFKNIHIFINDIRIIEKWIENQTTYL